MTVINKTYPESVTLVRIPWRI